MVPKQTQDPGVEFERLVLVTRDGEKIPVQGQMVQSSRESYGLPPRSRAQQLNNHIFRTKE